MSCQCRTNWPFSKRRFGRDETVGGGATREPALRKWPVGARSGRPYAWFMAAHPKACWHERGDVEGRCGGAMRRGDVEAVRGVNRQAGWSYVADAACAWRGVSVRHGGILHGIIAALLPRSTQRLSDGFWKPSPYLSDGSGAGRAIRHGGVHVAAHDCEALEQPATHPAGVARARSNCGGKPDQGDAIGPRPGSAGRLRPRSRRGWATRKFRTKPVSPHRR